MATEDLFTGIQNRVEAEYREMMGLVLVTQNKTRFLQAARMKLYLLGTIDLPRAIDYWHDLARRMVLPPSVIDREVQRAVQIIKADERYRNQLCQDPATPAKVRFDLKCDVIRAGRRRAARG